MCLHYKVSITQRYAENRCRQCLQCTDLTPRTNVLTILITINASANYRIIQVVSNEAVLYTRELLPYLFVWKYNIDIYWRDVVSQYFIHLLNTFI